MSEIITPSNIMFVLGIFGVAFGIWNKVRTPQEDLEKQQALTDKEVNNKAAILAQQLQWEKDSNERRFKELNESATLAGARADNHIHSIDVKVDSITVLVNDMNLRMGSGMAELRAIINERIPKHL